MELFILIWYCCTCTRLIHITAARNVTAMIAYQYDYDGVKVSRQTGHVGELCTHEVIDPNDSFTNVLIFASDNKLENISPTKMMEVYRFLNGVLLFKVLNTKYSEHNQGVGQKYLYYTVVDDVITTCSIATYYRMFVPFYGPCKHIELPGPSCYFSESMAESGDIIYDIVGRIYDAEIYAHNKHVYCNRVSTANRLIKIRSYSIYYIPFIDIVVETPNDIMFTMTFIWYMDAWTVFRELKGRLNFMHYYKGVLLPQSSSRRVESTGGSASGPLHSAALAVTSPIKITIDLEMDREPTPLVTIEKYPEPNGEINIFICSTACVFGEVFFRGSIVFADEEYSPYIISLHRYPKHNVIYTLPMHPFDVQLREYTQISHNWVLKIIHNPSIYFYVLVLDPKQDPDRRMYNKEYKKDGRNYTNVFTPKKLIGFAAVLVEENGIIISRSIDNVIFCEVRLRGNIRKYMYYQNDRRMMMTDTRRGSLWTHGVPHVMVDL